MLVVSWWFSDGQLGWSKSRLSVGGSIAMGVNYPGRSLDDFMQNPNLIAGWELGVALLRKPPWRFPKWILWCLRPKMVSGKATIPRNPQNKRSISPYLIIKKRSQKKSEPQTRHVVPTVFMRKSACNAMFRFFRRSGGIFGPAMVITQIALRSGRLCSLLQANRLRSAESSGGSSPAADQRWGSGLFHRK